MPDQPPSSASATAPRARRPLRWATLVPVVTILAGLMFAASFNTAQGGDIRSARDLPGLIIERDQTNIVAQRSVTRLQGDVDALTAQQSPSSAELARLRERTDRLAQATGFSPMRGPGVTVTLNDAQRDVASLPEGFSPDDIVVHEQDLQAVVNSLWANGAQGIMVMDQRLISPSAIRCVGNTLLLQGRVYSPPYVISAIGDPDILQAGLDSDPSITIYKQYVDAVGLGWEVKHVSVLDFPAHDGESSLTYARVANADGN